jgi:hypothetical protein
MLDDRREVRELNVHQLAEVNTLSSIMSVAKSSAASRAHIKRSSIHVFPTRGRHTVSKQEPANGWAPVLVSGDHGNASCGCASTQVAPEVGLAGLKRDLGCLSILICFVMDAGSSWPTRRIDTRPIQVFMSHSSIASMVIYTEIAPQRFKGFWKD